MNTDVHSKLTRYRRRINPIRKVGTIGNNDKRSKVCKGECTLFFIVVEKRAYRYSGSGDVSCSYMYKEGENGRGKLKVVKVC